MTENSTEAPSTNEAEEKKELSTTEIVLAEELRQHAEVARDYKAKIDDAKTDYKKQYYRKKLAKNNTQAFQILLALEESGRIHKLKEEFLNYKKEPEDYESSE